MSTGSPDGRSHPSAHLFPMMDRRRFMGTLSVGLIAAPLAADGQTAAKPPTLSAASSDDTLLRDLPTSVRR